MNRAYKLIWSPVTGSWRCVAENRPGPGKRCGSLGRRGARAIRAGAFGAAALLCLHASGALAGPPAPAPGQLPAGGQVVAGQAGIQQSGVTLNIDQATSRAAIDWQAFNIGASATVNFHQPDAQSVTLNRVLGVDPSQIYGHLNANGQVFLVNPDGVYFAPGSRVNVGGLAATTHSISNDDFMAGKSGFSRDGATGQILNLGRLSAAPGGYIALLAPEVRNEGVIVANLGTVALAGGEQITLNFGPMSQLASITVTGGAIKTLVENRQAILVEGGQIILSARAADGLMASVVNSGELSASSISSNGGRITIEAGDISLAGASRIAATGATGGGTVLVGGAGQGDASLHQADTVTMRPGSVIDVSATQKGDGGKVVLWSNLASGKTVAQGSITAKGAGGGNGGTVETSGDSVDFTGIAVDTSAPGAATGTWLTDPYDLTVDSAAAGTINTNLSTTNVTLQTTSSGTTGPGTANASGNGDIFVNSGLSWSSGNTLTLDAYRNVNINAAIAASNNGKVVIVTGDTAGNGTSGSATGDYSFGLGATGFAGNITFGSTAGSATLNIATGGTGAASAYTLVYALPTAVAGGTLANSGKYALANGIADTVTRTAAVYTAETGITFTGLGNTVSGLNITNATASGTAGLFGAVTTSTIRDFAVSGTVKGTTTTSMTGALVGQSLGSVIKNAYATAAITGASTSASFGTGGLVGVANSSGTTASTLSNLISAGTVTGGFDTGGVVGFLTSGTTAPSTLTNSSFTGATVSGTTNTGGLVGLTSETASSGSPTISNSFATGAVTATGTGTGGLIGTMNNFVAVSNVYATGNVSQTGGVGAASTGGLVGGSSGASSKNTITNSYATGAVSTNGANSTPGAAAGGLVGYMSNTSLSMDYATGTMTDTGGHGGLGGLVGYAITSTVSQSYATGNVSSLITGANFYGGLIGQANTVDINTSFATGNVSGGNYVGGLVGYTISQFSFTDVYANGSVTATNTTANAAVGGLLGSAIPNGATSYVTNAYASGAVSATTASTNIGGLIGAWGGSNGGTTVVTNGYWDSTATGQSGAAATTGAGGTLRFATGTAVPTTSNNTVSTRTAGAQTTTQLTNGTMPGNFNTSVTGNGNPWNTMAGFYPYFSYQYPNGAEAISGTAYTSAGAAAAGATVTLYSGGSALSGGSRTTAADGTYTALVNAGSVTGATPLAGTLKISSIVGASYTDAPTYAGGNVTGFDLRQGLLLATTSATTNSALQTSLGATFGSATYSGLVTTLAASQWQYNASGNLTVDTAISHAGVTALTSGGNLAINAGVTSTGSTILLKAAGTVTDGASGILTASNLVLRGGAVTLDNAASNVATLAATGVTSLAYADADALTIGSVGPYLDGVTAAGINGASATTAGISAGGDIMVAATALTVSGNIATTSAAADSTLTLKASGNLTVTTLVTVNTASSHKLNTILWSDSDNSGQGLISLTNDTITTNGGQLWMGGGAATAGTGAFSGLTIGNGYATATTIANLSYGLFMTGTTASTGAGSIAIAGKYAPASAATAGGVSYGVRMINDSLSTSSGDITFDGQSSGAIAGGGGIFMAANGGNFALSTDTGAISVKGNTTDAAGTTGGTGVGIYIQALNAGNTMSIQSNSGAVTVDGQASFANDPSASNFKAALYLQSQVATSILTIASGSGDVTVKGNLTSNGSSGVRNGIALLAGDGSGVITLGGSTGALKMQASSILQQNTNAGAGSIALLGTGAVTIEPIGTSFVAMRAGYPTPSGLTFDDDWNFGTAHSAVTIGSSSNTFDLTLSQPLTAAGPISILGGNLSVAALTSTGGSGLVTLDSNNSGTIVQTGAITAAALDVLGAATATLTNSGNNVGTLAGSGLGSFSYVDADALTIGTVGGANGIGASGAVSVATMTGDLTLSKTVSTTNTGSSAITLNAGQSQAAGTATGGNIVVSGGSVSTGSGGRATLYSGSLSETSLAGLVNASGHYRYNSDEATTNYTTALGSGLYAIYRQAIAIAANDASTVYGTAATLTSNAVNGDTASLGVTAPALSTSGNIGVGSYGIAVTNLPALAGLGYTTTGTTGATLTVTAKPVTVSGITGMNRAYNGGVAAAASGSNAVIGGLVTGDQVTVSATGTFADKNVGAGKTVTLSGSYAGADAGNYSFTGQATTMADITPALLTLSTSDVTKVYDGTISVTGGAASVVGGTLFSGDTLSGGSFAYVNKNAAAGTKVVTIAGVTVSDGDSGADYTISYQSNVTSTITPAAFGIGGVTAANKTYDGTTNATIDTSAATYTGQIAGDDISVSVTGAFADKNAGPAKTVNLTATLAGADAGDYAVSGQTSTTANIAKAALAVTANADARFVTQTDTAGYDGVNYTGFVAGETASTALDTSGLAVTRPNAVSDVAAGTYAGALVPSGVTAANYAISYAFGSYTIIPANNALVRVANTSAVYGSAASYTVNSVQYLDNSDVISDLTLSSNSGNSYSYVDGAGGTISFALNPSGAVVSSGGLTAVGNYAIADASPTIGGGNLTGSVHFVGDLAVTPKAVTASASGVGKVYDGTTAMAGVTLGLAGKETGDDLTVDGTGAFSQKTVGTNLAYSISGLTLSGMDASDYYLNGGGSFSGSNGSITPAPLGISGITAASRLYDGTRTASVDVSGAVFSGLISGDDVSVSATGLFSDKNAGTAKTVTLTDSFGGADAGNYTIAGQAGTAADITPMALTLGTGNITKVYDGTTAITGGTAMLIGGTLFSGDTLGGGIFAYTDKSAGTGTKVVTVGGVTVDDGDGGADYTVSYQNNTTSTITPAALSISGITAASRAYNGTRNASVNTGGAVLSGLISGDDVSISATGLFADKNVGAAKTVTLTDSFGGADAGNYTITGQATTTADIAQAALTLSTGNVTKLYDGTTAVVGGAAAVTGGTLFSGDTLSGGAFAYIGKNAGAGNKDVTVSGITVSDGNGGANYAVTYADNTTSAITPATLSVSGLTAASRSYDGTRVASVDTSGAVYAGLIAGDDVSISATGLFSDKNVGNAKAVALSDSFGGADAGNYTITGQASAVADITQASLTLSTGNVTKLYDGTANVVGGTATVIGGTLFGGDTLVGGTFAYTDKNAGTGNKDVTVGGATVSDGNGGANYMVAYVDNTTSTITQAALTLSGLTVASRAYNGTRTANVDISGAVLSGLVPGDDVSVSASGLFTDKNAGTGKTVSLTDSFGGVDAANYAITAQAGTTADITPAALTLSTGNVTKAYDGTTSVTGGAATVTAGTLFSGDTLGGGAFAYANKNAGTGNKDVTVGGVTVSDGNGGANYTVAYADNITSTITPATLSIGGITAAGRIYDGTTNATVDTSAATYTGLIAGDRVTVSATGAFADKNAGTGKTVTLTDGVGGADAANYTVTGQASTTADIAKAPLTIAADADARFVTQSDMAGYDGVNYSGFVAGETAATALDTSGLSVTRPNAATDVAAGTYAGALVPGGVTAANYAITYANGDYTIVAAGNALIKVGNASTVYGSAASYPVNSVQYLDNNNVIGNLTLSSVSGNAYTYSDGAGGTISFALNPSGAVTSSAGLTAVGNYAIADASPVIGGGNLAGRVYFTGNLAVTPRAVTASASGVSKVYDGTTAMTGVALGLSGKEAGDDLTVNGTGAFSQRNVGANLGYSVAGLMLSGADSSDYYLAGGASFSGSDGTITPAALRISGIAAASRTYDGTRSAAVSIAGVVETGLIAGDDVEVSATGLFADKNAGAGKTVMLSSSYGGADAGNYTIAGQASTTADITPAALSIGGITAASRTYDGTRAATVDTSGMVETGLIAGDDVEVSATGLFADKNAGAGKTVMLSSSYGGADAGNYTIAGQASTTADITPAALSISGITAASRTYDGTRAATVDTSGMVETGLIAGDDVEVSATGLFADRNAGTGKTVTLARSIGGTDAGNYTITGQVSTLADITPASLTLGTGNVSKVYDGTTAVTGAGATVVGGTLFSGDTLSGGAFSYTDKNAGSGDKTVTVGGVAVNDGNGGANYAVAYVDNTTSTIAPKPLAVVGAAAENKVFDGNASDIVDAAMLIPGGVLPGDDVSLANGAAGTFGDSAVGNDKPVTTAMSLGGADRGNYSLIQPMGVTADITPVASSPPAPPDHPLPPIVPPTAPPLPGSAPPTPAGLPALGGGPQPAGPGGAGEGSPASGPAGHPDAPQSFTLLNSPGDARANGGDFISVRQLEPQELRPGTPFSYVLPTDTFVHSDPAAALTWEARLADGDPLPAWLHFEPGRLRFYGTAPADAQSADVVVIAHDRQGHEARARLMLIVKRQAGLESGRP